jgi:hypothetical protein
MKDREKEGEQRGNTERDEREDNEKSVDMRRFLKQRLNCTRALQTASST